MLRRVAALLAGLVAFSAMGATGTGPGGYTWKDCAEADGPACDYVIAAATDGLTGLCSDEVYRQPGGIGFAFPYYGSTFTALWVSANGAVYLANAASVVDDVNAPLSGLEGLPLLAPMWDDWAMDNDDELGLLCPDPGCANSGPITFVESYRLGSGIDGSGLRYRDVEWFDTAKHRPACSEPETATFGLRLYEDGRILFNYLDVAVGQPGETDAGASSTIGISRGSAGHFTQVSFDAAVLPAVPHAILFIPPCPALACTGVTAPADACEGDVVRLTVNVTGGEAPLSVEWDLDGDGAFDVAGNPVDVTLPPGPNAVEATVTDSCAVPAAQSCTVSAVVSVHALPRPIVTALGATAFCGADGESVTLQADVGYASYQWSRDGSDLPGATTRTITATVSGSYVVRVVDAFGCAGASDPSIVDAEDCSSACSPLTCADVVVSPSPACEGSLVTVTVLAGGGEGAIAVEWDLDGDGTADASGNPLRRVFLAGTTTITAIVTDSCALPAPQRCLRDADVIVTPPPQPVITPLGPTEFCAARGESVDLDAGTGWASVQWTFEGRDIGFATDPVLTADRSGTYTVRVTDAGGCTGESLPVVVDAVTCPSLCDSLACASVVVDPPVACEGEPQELLLVTTGGTAPIGVAWDVDGDGVPDAFGNPVSVTLAPGVHSVRGVAADTCADPGPQSCDALADAEVLPGASVLGEASGRGEEPLLVLSPAALVEVHAEPAATAHHAYVDAIGSWWAPSDATGRACDAAVLGPGARPGTILLDVPMPAGSWILVTGANACAEGDAGRSSQAVDRAGGPGWTACGPAP